LAREYGGNVHDKCAVEVTSSGPLTLRPWDAATNAADVDTDSFFCSQQRKSTDDIPETRNNWLCYDFKNRRVLPTHYAIRTSRGAFIQSWAVDVSDDGQQWIQVDRRDDVSETNAAHTVTRFDVPNGIECRFVRLVNIGRNHRRDDCLWISAFEIFGALIEITAPPERRKKQTGPASLVAIKMGRCAMFLECRKELCGSKVTLGPRPYFWRLDNLDANCHIITSRGGLVIGSSPKPHKLDITMGTRCGRKTQQWSFNADLTITSVATGLAMDVNHSNPRSGVPVVLAYPDGRPNQTWQCVPEGGFLEQVSRREFPPVFKLEKVQIQVRDDHCEVEIECPDGIIAQLTRECHGNVHDQNVVEVTSSRPCDDDWSSSKYVADMQSEQGFESETGRVFGSFQEDQIPKKEENCWICYDFKSPRVIPTYYTFRSFFLNSWLVESSTDGENWVEIDRRENSPGAPDARTVQMFPVATSQRCRYLQLVNIGANRLGEERLEISAWEIFGTLIEWARA
jgi:hypothetical protein